MKTYKEFMQFISDHTEGSNLLEMAIERKQIVKQVENLRSELAVHIVKIIVLDDNQAKHHWESEINSWVNKIQGMVYDRKKRLTDDQYFSLLWEDIFFEDRAYRGILKSIKADGHIVPADVSDADRLKIKLIYRGLARKISDGKFEGISKLVENLYLK